MLLLLLTVLLLTAQRFNKDVTRFIWDCAIRKSPVEIRQTTFLLHFKPTLRAKLFKKAFTLIKIIQTQSSLCIYFVNLIV